VAKLLMRAGLVLGTTVLVMSQRGAAASSPPHEVGWLRIDWVSQEGYTANETCRYRCYATLVARTVCDNPSDSPKCGSDSDMAALNPYTVEEPGYPESAMCQLDVGLGHPDTDEITRRCCEAQGIDYWHCNVPPTP